MKAGILVRMRTVCEVDNLVHVHAFQNVILSEAKDLHAESALDPEILRFAQDDN